jgi:transcriptional regulator with XRE-family HTH domain
MAAKPQAAALRKASGQSAKIVAGRLVALREERGLSQARLAELAGIDRKTINRIEKNRFSPSLDTLTRISVVLRCRLADLVGGKSAER